MTGGIFLSFEGLEGSGKSTQVGLLGGKLREKKHEIVVTREPGGTRIGEQIRTITHGRENVDLTAMAESYLMAASRAQHVREIIRPALQAGKIVICDRYVDSSLAYQGYGRKIGEEIIWQINQPAVEKTLPDLTIFLDISPHESLNRRNHTDKIDRLDLQQRDFYERVYRGYRQGAKKFGNRIITIDAIGEISAVAETIWNEITNRFPTL